MLTTVIGMDEDKDEDEDDFDQDDFNASVGGSLMEPTRDELAIASRQVKSAAQSRKRLRSLPSSETEDHDQDTVQYRAAQSRKRLQSLPSTSETEDHNQDTIRYRKAVKEHASNGRVKLMDYEADVQEIAKHAKNRMEIYYSTVSPYPTPTVEYQIAQIAWRDACVEVGVKIEPNSEILGLVRTQLDLVEPNS